jgi:hypothetical protein
LECLELAMIEVVLGEGIHSVRCELAPTSSGSVYVGSARRREIVCERSREEQLKAELALAAGFRVSSGSASALSPQQRAAIRTRRPLPAFLAGA